MRNYENGKIYKITNDFNESIYIGSTCDTLDKRMQRHKIDKDKHPNRLLYKLMNEIGFVRFRIELLENFPCSDKYELLQREAAHIRNSQNLLNSEIPGRTEKEWYQDNKEMKKSKSKEYYDLHKAEILQKYSEKIICLCGLESSRFHLTRHMKSKKHHELLK